MIEWVGQLTSLNVGLFSLKCLNHCLLEGYPIDGPAVVVRGSISEGWASFDLLVDLNIQPDNGPLAEAGDRGGDGGPKRKVQLQSLGRGGGRARGGLVRLELGELKVQLSGAGNGLAADLQRGGAELEVGERVGGALVVQEGGS